MTEFKRYAVFCFEDYYPTGGWNDLSGLFTTLQQATDHINEKAKIGSFNAQVVDLLTGNELLLE